MSDQPLAEMAALMHCPFRGEATSSWAAWLSLQGCSTVATSGGCSGKSPARVSVTSHICIIEFLLNHSGGAFRHLFDVVCQQDARWAAELVCAAIGWQVCSGLFLKVQDRRLTALSNFNDSCTTSMYSQLVGALLWIGLMNTTTTIRQLSTFVPPTAGKSATASATVLLILTIRTLSWTACVYSRHLAMSMSLIDERNK
jgi:hypothetical protein